MKAFSDKGRIKQVLLNLLSNAFKFTFKGEIVLGCKIYCCEEGEYIAFTVKDTGIGIKKEDQKGLFRLFGMISNKNNLNPNGCGIGLTVSKKYISHLGGEIDFKSKEGVGTKVRFVIPCIRKNEYTFAFKTEELSAPAEENEENFSLPKSLGSEQYNFDVKTKSFA